MKKIILLFSFSLLALLAVTGQATASVDLSLFTHELKSDTLMPFAVAGIVLNKANLSILYTAFKSAFNTGFRTQETYWQRIATLVPSTTSEEKYGWLGQWPRLKEWLGDRQIKSLALHDYSIKNKKHEATVAIGKDELEDDSYGVYTPMMQEMGYAAATHPDELVFGLLPKGFTELCYDGQYFFDADHPVGDGSVSNMQAGAGDPWYLLSTRRPLKPLIFQRRKDYTFASMTGADDESVFMQDEFRYGIDARVNVGFGLWQTAFGSKATLDATNFDAAVQAGMELKSDEGRPLGIMYDLLVCGPSKRAAAKALIEKERLANGEDNINYQAVELLVVPWLA